MKCNICQQEKTTFSITVNKTEDPYVAHICDKCWDIIAAVAQLTQLAAPAPTARSGGE
jgi:hypothetical protein